MSPALHKQRLGSSKTPKADFHLPVPAPPAAQPPQQAAQLVYRCHLGVWAPSLEGLGVSTQPLAELPWENTQACI